MLKLLTTADRVLIVLVSVGTIASYLAVGAFLSRGTTFEVEVNGALVYRTNPENHGIFQVEGVHGMLELEVSDKGIRVVRADCPNQVCVRTGWRNRAGDVIVCAPNKTIVRISGSRSGGVRGVTG